MTIRQTRLQRSSQCWAGGWCRLSRWRARARARERPFRAGRRDLQERLLRRGAQFVEREFTKKDPPHLWGVQRSKARSRAVLAALCAQVARRAGGELPE